MQESREERTLTELEEEQAAEQGSPVSVETGTADAAVEQDGAALAENEPSDAGDPLSALRMELEAERRERQAAEDRALRYRADYENLRRRTAMETEQTRLNLLRDMVEKLLPVLDDMDRALATAEAEAPPSWVAGLEMIQRRFLTSLAEFGVARMESVGQPFDPEKHEAMLRVEDSEHPPQTVVEDLRPGYTIGDRVIRPALVKVQV